MKTAFFLACFIVFLGAASAEERSGVFTESLPMDIRASSFSELAAWCEELGLSSQGSRTDLESRLFSHYGVTPPAKEKPGESVIDIQSADSTEYFTLEQFDEDYVRLDGGVRISLKDAEKGYTYEIKADSVLFNQTLKLLSASGGVEYKITGEGRDEVFSGESLTLNTETWEGYFFEGASFRDRTIDKETLKFRIQGDFISRSSRDFVVMDDAWITSSPRIPANYRIKAEKVWILGPGEWGIRNASLYVGHIPVFYLPFFFYPGDEVLFHPVFGYRSREGTFVQTTTYFMGNRKTEELPLSFLQLTENDKNDRVKERHGIFLRDTDEKIQFPDRYVKGFFDVYSRLGGFAGISGSLPGIAPFAKTLVFDGGIGVSRNLYFGQSGLGGDYTPYWTGDGNIRDFWNTTRMGEVEFPFRFGGTASLSAVFGKLTASVLLESFSDPYFNEDFLDRKEQIDWAQLMEGVLEEEPTVILKDRLTWKIESAYMPTVTALSPLVTSFNLSRFLVSFDWRSKEIPKYDPDNPAIQLLPDYAVTDPTRRFYYPDAMILPEISLQLGGTLASSEKRSAAQPPRAEAPEEDVRKDELRPPWTDQETPREKETVETFKVPDVQKDLPLAAPPPPLGYTVTYQIRPKAVYQFKTDAKDWDLPQDIGYDFAYATLTFENTAQILYDLRFYGSMLQTKGSLGFTTQYQNIDYRSDSLLPAEKSSLDLQAYKYRSQNLTHNFDATAYPLSMTDMFKSVNLRYQLQTSLYKRSFDSLSGSEPVYKDEFATFSRNMVTAHRASMDIVADTLPVTPKVQISYICPPLDEVFSVSGGLITGPLTSTVTYLTKNEADRWRSQPLSFDELLKFGDHLEFRAVYLHDFSEDTPYSLSSSARLWYLTGNFQAKYTEPYSYAGAGSGWIKEADKEFIPSSASVGLKYALKPEPFWKNRVLLSADVTGDWQMNLIQYTESALTFGLNFTFSIHRFLDIKFSSLSKNTMMYHYFPGYAEGVEREWRNPLTDLLKSFNFFNTDDRYESYFKLSTISFEAVHHLDDWDLSVAYSGKPELVTNANGTRDFIWKSELGIALRWKPIPQIKSEFSVK